MRARRIAIPAALGALALLAGCGTLSGAGPSVDTMRASKALDVVRVTPVEAGAEAEALAHNQAAVVAQALASLSAQGPVSPTTFSPGAQLGVVLWSYSPRPDLAAGPAATPLGQVAVAADGTVFLPYLGQVKLAGLTLKQAQRELARRYAALGLFQKPSITISAGFNPQGGVLVTGSLGAPKKITWPAEGLTLADALTQSLGDGAVLLGHDDPTPDHYVPLNVTVLRRGGVRAELPISIALSQSIALRPADRIIVTKAPLLKVTVLGAGVQSNGVFAFAHTPTLSEVLARGAGLNANAADDHAVFVLREHQGAKPVLYDFSWNKPQGLVASHRFSMMNGDLIYVAEAPIVSMKRVADILFQVALPAQVLK